MPSAARPVAGSGSGSHSGSGPGSRGGREEGRGDAQRHQFFPEMMLWMQVFTSLRTVDTCRQYDVCPTRVDRWGGFPSLFVRTIHGLGLNRIVLRTRLKTNQRKENRANLYVLRLLLLSRFFVRVLCFVLSVAKQNTHAHTPPPPPVLNTLVTHCQRK